MEQNTTNKPLRRVGTLTLGVCLIAAGTLFLLARFLPGLPWLVIWQVLPAAGLILLGCEVLYYSARPGASASRPSCCWPRCWAAAAPSTCEHKKACAASRPGSVCTGFFV